MKALGIVRKIDSLGRIVIPMEIRRLNNIKEGDPLEIYSGNDGSIVLKKYNPSSDIIKQIESIESNIGEYINSDNSYEALKLINKLKNIIKNI